ncbi:putative cyclin binding protein [Lyophyllum shimeji]|uniref:Cyclin binding protein n=1 Tax=Lyophyllum shimeji TaxID=47721 RepID=A0A9P3ULK8_LYOSH|nr:putative cyclin binding protein [Lyophyllum shimeji]
MFQVEHKVPEDSTVNRIPAPQRLNLGYTFETFREKVPGVSVGYFRVPVRYHIFFLEWNSNLVPAWVDGESSSPELRSSPLDFPWLPRCLRWEAAGGMTDKKNPLTIRLTESAVFLRSDGTGRRNHGRESRPSLLRGLLVLELAKPTRITSIELELVAKSSTAWPEGIGARRTEVTEEHKLFHAETVYFRAGKVQTRRNSSIGPGAAAYYHGGGYESDDQHTPSYTPRDQHEAGLREPTPLYDTGVARRSARRLSADSSFFQRVPLSHEEYSVPPTPPYSPLSPSSSLSGDLPHLSSAQTLEDFRNSLNAGLRSARSRSTGVVPSNSSVRSSRADVPLSRRPRIFRSHRLVPTHVPLPGRPRVHQVLWGHLQVINLENVGEGQVLAPASIYPRFQMFSWKLMRRGRTKEKGEHIQDCGSEAVQARSKERSTLSRIGDLLKIDHEESSVECGWKEFKKGTYTYPISFTIPSNAPPTLRCNYGTVTWRLIATVHRPGAFKSRYAANREVIVIASPIEEDTEDSENIIIERHWDQQLQYLISVSGRSFYIGGTIPITFTLMPLSKVRVHRISIFIEERVDYYTHMKRIARTDPLTHIPLLALKHEGKHAGHILPLESDDPEAFENSPLFALVTPDDDPSEMASSLMGPGPWTFHQDLQLPTSCSVIRFTNKNRRSNVVITHQLKCVMRVERGDDLHLDPKTGKRKLFDIVIQTPIQILSCRCHPDWASLPRYSETFDDTSTVLPKCPCDVRRDEEIRMRSLTRPSPLERMTSKHSADSVASAAETSPVNPGTMPSLRPQDSLYGRSTQYERLISGQESETGEAPPAYAACLGQFSQQSL